MDVELLYFDALGMLLLETSKRQKSCFDGFFTFTVWVKVMCWGQYDPWGYFDSCAKTW